LDVLWNERCWTRSIASDLTSALADCNAVIQLTQQDASPLDAHGLIYLKTGQWDAASADYTAALKMDPKIAFSLYGRGFAEPKKASTAANPKVADKFSR
jgi:tetratricopeptide (TPR) repeat protein